MADYHVDINGNITKKKKNKRASYKVDINGNVTKAFDSNTPSSGTVAKAIAPVKETTSANVAKTKAGRGRTTTVTAPIAKSSELSTTSRYQSSDMWSSQYKQLLEEEKDKLTFLQAKEKSARNQSNVDKTKAGRSRKATTTTSYDESAEVKQTKQNIAELTSLYTDKKHAEEYDAWDTDTKTLFDNYSKAMANRTSNARVSLTTQDGEYYDPINKMDDAADKLVKGLSKKGYSTDEIKSIMKYAQRVGNEQGKKDIEESLKEVSEKGVGGKVVASAESVANAILGGAGMISATAQKLTRGTDAITGEKSAIDFNTPAFSPSFTSSKLREEVSENMSPVGSFFYNAGMSIADFATAAAVGGGSSNVSGAIMATNAGSQSMQAAKERGATDDQAFAIGVVSATAEMAFEKVSLENLKIFQTKGGNKLALVDHISNIAKQSFTEASEETCTTIANTIADAWIMGDKSEFNNSVNAYMENGKSEEEAYRLALKDWAVSLGLDALAGAFSGGVTGSGMSVINAMSQNSVTENEQKVIDKEVANRVAEEESDGKKLTDKDKKVIEKQVMTALEKGQISIDTIESAIGGETYDSYKAISEQEESLQKEFDTLNKMKQGDMTGEQIDRRVELKQQLQDFKSTSNKAQIKEQLSNKVAELAKSDRLSEAYNEKARKSEAFQADLNKYDAKQKATVQKAVESGILNNTNRTHEFVDMLAKISADKGVSFDFVNNAKLKESGFVLEGRTVNGYQQGNNIGINIDSAKALNRVVGHEITHVLEGTELYSELQNVIKEYATTKGEYDARLKEIRDLYKDNADANIDNELTADLVGDYLFTDSDFINSLSTNSPNIFKRIYEEIKYFVKVATAGGKEARQLEKVKRAFDKAWKQSSKSDSSHSITKFSLSVNEYLKPYSEHHKENWKNSKKIVLYENEQQLNDFVEKAKNRENAGQKLYFGIIKNEVSERVKNKLGHNIEGYNCALYSDNVRKIFKDHGDEAKENLRGQRAVVTEDFSKIPEIISSPETIESGGYYKGFPVVHFKKNGVTIVGVITDGALDLYPQTMYISKKNRSLATVIDEQAPIYTPETTRSTASIKNSISPNQENATKNFSLSKDSGENTLTTVPTGNYNVYGKDIQLAPVRELTVEEEHKKIAQILDTEPKTASQRNKRKWAIFKANVFDKGIVLEDLSLKTKNRELMGKWNYTLYSEARAQRLMGNGSNGVKSLNDIRTEVENTGQAKEFYEYIYHKHNVDRMSLEKKARSEMEEVRKAFPDLDYSEIAALSRKRITEKTPTEDTDYIRKAKEVVRLSQVKNKPVFGDSVTAEVSQEIVDKYENTKPEFMDYAQDVYNYMNYLRQQLVDNGVISQETADLWQEMYPHYVPVRRVGDTGLNINVPLDTRKTGISAPIKRATGGNADILPLFDTMAARTLQTYRATAKNTFGVELKNTLGSTVENATTDVDEVIDSIDSQEGLLQEGKNGKLPTFTVFENGEKVTFEITESMYDALKPVSESSFLSKTIKPLNIASNIHRGLLTEYNPVFLLTNAIKDTQDVFINSQHPMKTYLKSPEAFAQILSGKGFYYNEYMANGGEQNTYFDNESKTFNAEKKGIKKFVSAPFELISRANNLVEMTPRLAEYIASRESGRSIEVSMLDAARVTTNFRAGGDLTKFLNRNGATFLNASVQGVMQQVRNVREANANGLKGWVGLATKFIAAGLPAVLLNAFLYKDDEEYEELSDYVKQNYYVFKLDNGKFLRFPKGRATAIIQDAFEQISNIATGNDEADLKNFLELAVSNLAPNNPIEDNILAPIIQVRNNETWYGDDLVPTRLQDLPDKEQYDESTDMLSRFLGEKLNYSPVKINYLLDQYTGGVGDVVLPMLTPEAESGADNVGEFLLAPLKGKFITDGVFNKQSVSDFYEMSDELTTNAKKSDATDEDVLKKKYFDARVEELAEYYNQKREVQNSDMDKKQKYAEARDIQKQINEATEDALKTYDDVSIDGNYATVGDRHYRLNEDREWQKITDKQLTKQKEVIEGLGITPSEYWGKKEEYDYAYDYPEKYAVAKSVGGYESYKNFSKDLSNIKADEDVAGNPISGSRKEKVIEYINNLDASYEEKIILFKNEYNSDDTYNRDIIDYLNGRSDISYKEMETILKALGFEVDSEGNVYW